MGRNEKELDMARTRQSRDETQATTPRTPREQRTEEQRSQEQQQQEQAAIPKDGTLDQPLDLDDEQGFRKHWEQHQPDVQALGPDVGQYPPKNRVRSRKGASRSVSVSVSVSVSGLPTELRQHRDYPAQQLDPPQV
jgi:hypothetical protein